MYYVLPNTLLTFNNKNIVWLYFLIFNIFRNVKHCPRPPVCSTFPNDWVWDVLIRYIIIVDIEKFQSWYSYLCISGKNKPNPAPVLSKIVRFLASMFCSASVEVKTWQIPQDVNDRKQSVIVEFPRQF